MTEFTGTIKSYGAQKGFGFIGSQDVAGDVYFQQKELPLEYQGLDLQLTGSTVSFELVHTQDGMPQGKGVQLLEAMTSPRSGGGGGGSGSPIDQSQMLKGEIRSYNSERGFGFVANPSIDGDFYFEKRDVPMQFQSMALVGAKVGFTPHVSAQGKNQARKLQFNLFQTGSMKGGFFGSGGCGGGFGGAPPMMGKAMGKGPGGMMMNQMGGGPPDGASMVGTVKTFDPAKGYGFLSVTGLPADVYFKPEGMQVEVGTTVGFTLKWMMDGKPQARQLVPALSAGKVVIGTVKSFSDKNGYGFIGLPDTTQDVYFNRQKLPVDMQAMGSNELQGSTLQFTVRLTPDGKPQAEDIAWVQSGLAPQGMKRPAVVNGAMPTVIPPKRTRVTPTSIYPTSDAGYVGGCMGGSMGVQNGGNEVVQGYIISFNVSKGYGFIGTAGTIGDVFFKDVMLPQHVRGQQLPQGTQVNFQLSYTPDGKPQASNIQIEVEGV